ncbi:MULTISPECIES: hypothetical protein [Paenibacillus]|jgi:hypothetical protein|uniref:hypothetical protein n=1 Tax=Paenibacillus TaxID=44249 RepID=UPI00073E9664|nr:MULTISPECIES: hypothetical protein [Paenibacillus]MDU4697550.1 hypothetical protein [Paenibacillus sp.]
MNSSKTLYQVTIELRRDQLASRIIPWRLLVETNRYYEIKPIKGPVKRLYKEKLNIAVYETKHYCDGTLAISAFCQEELIEEIRTYLIEQLNSKIDHYMNDLELNKKAIYAKLAINSLT